MPIILFLYSVKWLPVLVGICNVCNPCIHSVMAESVDRTLKVQKECLVLCSFDSRRYPSGSRQGRGGEECCWLVALGSSYTDKSISTTFQQPKHKGEDFCPVSVSDSSVMIARNDHRQSCIDEHKLWVCGVLFNTLTSLALRSFYFQVYLVIGLIEFWANVMH